MLWIFLENVEKRLPYDVVSVFVCYQRVAQLEQPSPAQLGGKRGERQHRVLRNHPQRFALVFRVCD